jgi:hypothetical protein
MKYIRLFPRLRSTDISEEYAAFIFRAEVFRFRSWQVARNVAMRLSEEGTVNKPDSGLE